ncbi:MAG: hypothetical protein AAF571_14370, partial [Verrucomicrobiota bacterium]
LHLEDRTYNITVSDCTLINNNNTTVNGKNFNSVVALTSPTGQFPEQLVRNVVIENSVVRGQCKWGMELVKFNSVTIRNVTFDFPSSNTTQLINSWTQGENLLLQSNPNLQRSDVSQGPNGFYSLPNGGWLNTSSIFL